MFTAYYKSLLVNSLVSSHYVGANCMEDDAEYLITLQRFVTQGLSEDEELEENELLNGEKFSFIPMQFSKVEPIEQRVLHYIRGYLFEKLDTTHINCTCLRDILKTDADVQETESFTALKEVDRRRKRLQYVNNNFFERMKLALQIIQFILKLDIQKKRSLCTHLQCINRQN